MSSVCVCSVTPPKAPLFDGTAPPEVHAATEEKGMSIPVIGSSELIHKHHKVSPSGLPYFPLYMLKSHHPNMSNKVEKP